MNFNIVEQKSSDFFEMYETIKKDVLDGVFVSEIREKYNLGNGQWLKFRKKLVEEGLIQSQQDRIDNAKYYYFNKSKKVFCVKRRINRKHIEFFWSKSEKECQMVVDKLHEYGWDKSNMPRIKKELGL